MSIDHKIVKKLGFLLSATRYEYHNIPHGSIKTADDAKHVFEHRFRNKGYSINKEVTLHQVSENVFYGIVKTLDFKEAVKYLLENESKISKLFVKNHEKKILNSAYKRLRTESLDQIFDKQTRRLLIDHIAAVGINVAVAHEYDPLFCPIITLEPEFTLLQHKDLYDLIHFNFHPHALLKEVIGLEVRSDAESFVDYKLNFQTGTIEYVKTKKEFPITVGTDIFSFMKILAISDDANDSFQQDHKYENRQDLTADQLALLRQFDLQGVQEIKSDQLRKLPFALNNPVLKKILDENPVLTPEAVLKYKPEELIGNTAQLKVYSDIRSVMKTGFREFNMGIQVLFPNEQNYAFVVGIPWEHVETVFGRESIQYLDNYTRNTKHPSLKRGIILTVGWVRFTKLADNNIWIDEIQTDLTKNTHQTDLDRLGGMNGITKFVLETFISTMRGKGFQTFYIPDLKTKHESYKSKPPESIYTELPKKMRFKLEPINETSLFKDSEKEKHDVSERIRKLSGNRVWVLAKKFDLVGAADWGKS